MSIREYIITLAALVAFLLLLTFGERRVEVNGGAGWDGQNYATIAEQIRTGQPIQADAPFLWRLGVPVLVAVSGLDIVTGFTVINTVAAIAFVLLFPFWLSNFVGDWRIRAALTVATLLPYVSQLRNIAWTPVTVDAPFMLLVVVGLLLVEAMRVRWQWRYLAPFAVLCVVGMAFREAMLVLPITALVAVYPQRRRYQAQTVVLALTILISVGVLALIVQSLPAPNDYGFLDSVHTWAYRKSIPDYLLSWGTVYGSLIALVVANLPTVRAFFTEYRHLAAFTTVVLFFTWFGGSDTVRFLWWLMPVFYALVAVILSQQWNTLRRAPLLLTALTIVWLVMTRAIVLPTPPATSPTYITPLLTWWSDGLVDLETAQVGAFRLSFWLLTQQVVALVVLTWWTWRVQRDNAMKPNWGVK